MQIYSNKSFSNPIDIIKAEGDLKQAFAQIDTLRQQYYLLGYITYDFKKLYFEVFDKFTEYKPQAPKQLGTIIKPLISKETYIEAINKIKSLPAKELARFLDDETTDAEIAQAQDTIYAYNNNKLYEYIDLQKESGELTHEQATAVESLTQSILEGMSAEEAWVYAKDDDGKKVQALARSLQELTMVVKDINGKMVTLNVGSILNSDDYSLKDQIEAFEKTRDAVLEEYGSASEEFKAFSETFSQYDFFTTLTSIVPASSSEIFILLIIN